MLADCMMGDAILKCAISSAVSHPVVATDQAHAHRLALAGIALETMWLSSKRCLSQAFVGYRDMGDRERIVKLDFLDESRVKEFQDFVRKVVASGGGDTCEDVAGGLAVRSRKPKFCMPFFFEEVLADAVPNARGLAVPARSNSMLAP